MEQQKEMLQINDEITLENEEANIYTEPDHKIGEII